MYAKLRKQANHCTSGKHL